MYAWQYEENADGADQSNKVRGEGKEVEPTGDCYICNLHYADFIGLSILLGPHNQHLPGSSREYCRGPVRKKTHSWEIQCLKRKKVSDSEDMDIVDMPGCSLTPTTPDAEARMKELALMNISLHNLIEHLQEILRSS